MVGRASLIVIVGFSILFGFASQYWNKSSNNAVTNFVNYYDTTVAHNIAVSAANIACDSVYFGGWNDTLATTHMPSGSLGSGTYNISVASQSWSGYKYIFVTASSQYTDMGHTYDDTVKIVFQPKNFAGYAFFTQNENGVYWANGDLVTGPFHTEGYMYISGAPVFNGKATTVKGIQVGSGGNHAKFNGGFQSGAATHVVIPTDFSATESEASSGATFKPGYSNSNFSSNSNSTNTGSNYTYDVYLTFNSNGTVTISDKQEKYSSGTWTVLNTTPAKTVSINSLANIYGQTVILVKNGDVHVSGVLSGDVTIVADTISGSKADRSSTTSTNYFSSSQAGNVVVEGNMTYNNSSTDMLGLVAMNSVALDNQASTGDITIDAAIFAKNGSWTYLDYDGSINGFPTGKTGTLNVLGSITQNLRGAVSTINSSGTVLTGYVKNYAFDQRFYHYAPPYFPVASNQFEIVSWRE